MATNDTRPWVYLRRLGAALALFACVSMAAAWVLGWSAPTSVRSQDDGVSVAPEETVVGASEEATSSRTTLTVSNESAGVVRLKELI